MSPLLAGILLVASFVVLIKSVDVGIRYAERLAKLFHISPFVISFFLIGLLGALPEGMISFSASIAGDSETAFLSLIASNVADLTLVFGIAAIMLSGLAVDSPVVRKDSWYLLLMAAPLVLGADGAITRWEGFVLMLSGFTFMVVIARHVNLRSIHIKREDYWTATKVGVTLVLAMVVLLASANAVVELISIVAGGIGVPQFIISTIVVGIGVCLPEMIFTIMAVRRGKNDLALGNVLAVVIIDATIMLGISSMINPIVVEAVIIRVAALYMAIAAVFLMGFIRFNKKLSWPEGVLMIAMYITFLYVTIARIPLVVGS